TSRHRAPAPTAARLAPRRSHPVPPPSRSRRPSWPASHPAQSPYAGATIALLVSSAVRAISRGYTMTSGDLCLSDLTASELAHAVRAGRVTPAAVVEHFLQRIEVIDPRLGAFEVVRRERALAEAKALSARDDLDRLPLAGIPVAIKDNTDVAGEPSRWGTPLIPAEPRPADDEVVRRLRAAGAIGPG